MSEYSIGEAIHKFLQRSHLKNGVRAIQIEEIWEKLMGKTIAQYTDKIQIVNQKLFITTSVGPLKNELMYQKNQIMKGSMKHLVKKLFQKLLFSKFYPRVYHYI